MTERKTHKTIPFKKWEAEQARKDLQVRIKQNEIDKQNERCLMWFLIGAVSIFIMMFPYCNFPE